MRTPKVTIYDPPLCCSTGICGPQTDPELIQFAADIEWLKAQDVKVDRYNLAQQPAAFSENKQIKKALKADEDCLPIVYIDNSIRIQGVYPTRLQLIKLLKLSIEEDRCCGESESDCEPSCCEDDSDCCSSADENADIIISELSGKS